MKIKELIEELNKHNPEAEIEICVPIDALCDASSTITPEDSEKEWYEIKDLDPPTEGNKEHVLIYLGEMRSC